MSMRSNFFFTYGLTTTMSDQSKLDCADFFFFTRQSVKYSAIYNGTCDFQLISTSLIEMQAAVVNSHALPTYMGFVKRPEIFLQDLLSPPQTPHLSNFLLEPSLLSQPALLHLPWTQTPEESGEHGVPSTTCKGHEKSLQEDWHLKFGKWIGHLP